ncbi:hypothetical protein V6Z11_D08G156900 [Gossypium hirsutum]|uniref:Uncharacterized protein n=1 Tax=Gossypium tomentosum TaxID=34277 RepID=A0A5D2JVG9_GOSTO|nr:hypothetical protein ES332_D08G166400v1 [Gossypium tomentosum]
MAEWSKAPDSSSGPRERAWVQIPLLTFSQCFFLFGSTGPVFLTSLSLVRNVLFFNQNHDIAFD